jgi:nitrite reductase/ring-hydroxylating ferredoxin subunit
MEIDRRVVVTGALALSAAAFVGLPAHASELNLGSSSAIKIGSSKVFTSGSNRILVYRQTATKFLAYRAICPSDSTSISTQNIRGSRVTCASEKISFSLVTGKASAGGKRLEAVTLRVSKGFLIVTLPAVVSSPSPSVASKPLISASQVPVGSGVRVDSALGALMIVQPRAGNFRAFSAVCTHAGCEVTDVTVSEMICNCHGSVFSTEDGAVTQGPARRGLRQYELVQRDGQLYLQP